VFDLDGFQVVGVETEQLEDGRGDLRGLDREDVDARVADEVGIVT
jgi:hypothetical protein